jgi:hypothetical protein
MTKRLLYLALATGVLVLTPAFAQGRQGAAKPDFNGVWIKGGANAGLGAANPTRAEGAPAPRGGNPAAGNPRFPVSQWSTEQLPFTPAGKAKLEANKSGKGPRAVLPAFGNDPLGQANPPGLYRTLIYNRAFEMVQTPTKIVQIFEWSRAWRIIWLDGREAPDDVPAGPFWYGESVGRWEGDTLVVNTLGVDSRAWLDEWGTPFSDDARFEERWRRTAPNKLEVTIKVTDPKTYSAPWTSIPVSYNLEPELELTEQIFAPIDELEFNKRVRDPAAGIRK